MGLIDTGIQDVVLSELARYKDSRGWLAEFFRMDEVDHLATMAYVSMTRPGVARGPHEHARQTDLFAFAGPGSFTLYLYDNRPESPSHGVSYSDTFGAQRQARIIIPPHVIHAYRCVSETEGLVINLPNKLYAGPGKSEPVDEIRHEDSPDSPFYKAFDRSLFILPE